MPDAAAVAPRATSPGGTGRTAGRRAPAGASKAGDAVYEQLRQEIVDGVLLPHQRLVEADLCARLETSRGTVRAVLLRLDHEGLVVREPNRGAHVRFIDETEAVEITQARAVLEALAARQAALMATDDDLARLRTIHAEMRPLLDQGDLLSYSETNRRLHACIIEISRHATAQRLLSGLKAQLVRYQYRTILVPGRPQQSWAEHTALVEAVCRRDPDGAASAMTAHLGGVATTLHAAAGQRASGPRPPTT